MYVAHLVASLEELIWGRSAWTMAPSLPSSSSVQPELCAPAACGMRAEAQCTIWGPRKYWGKTEVCEVGASQNRPQGGHPNGYRQKKGQRHNARKIRPGQV